MATSYNEHDLQHFDVIIVGAGSGNMIPGPAMDSWRLAIVEPDKFGGTCLNRGCIPSKMLIYTADAVETARHARQMGIHHRLERVDWQRVVGRVWEKIDPIAADGAAYRAAQDNVTVFDQPARFVAQRILESGGHYITADRIVLAAGSRPVLPDLPGLDNVPYHTSDTIMRLARQPASLLIIGGGYISAELAHFFGALGTRVTIVDHGAALIKREDHDIAQAFTAHYQQRFNVLLNTHPKGISRSSDGVTGHFEAAGQRLDVTAEVVLFAIGRQPNSDRLNVAAAGIDVDSRGRVLTDASMETSVPGIYALGDLASPYALKHIANAEARHIARLLLGQPKHPVAYDGVPHAVFADPQVASVGLTEREAQQQGLPYRTAKRMYADTAYGWASEDTTGFVKLVADANSRQLLGAHIIGPQASVLIQTLVQGMKYGQTVDEMAQVIYIHPAITEVVEQALLAL